MLYSTTSKYTKSCLYSFSLDLSRVLISSSMSGSSFKAISRCTNAFSTWSSEMFSMLSARSKSIPLVNSLNLDFKLTFKFLVCLSFAQLEIF